MVHISEPPWSDLSAGRSIAVPSFSGKKYKPGVAQKKPGHRFRPLSASKTHQLRGHRRLRRRRHRRLRHCRRRIQLQPPRFRCCRDRYGRRHRATMPGSASSAAGAASLTVSTPQRKRGVGFSLATADISRRRRRRRRRCHHPWWFLLGTAGCNTIGTAVETARLGDNAPGTSEITLHGPVRPAPVLSRGAGGRARVRRRRRWPEAAAAAAAAAGGSARLTTSQGGERAP